MIKKYGVEIPLQNLNIMNKLKKTNIKKYGVEHPAQNEEIKLKMVDNDSVFIALASDGMDNSDAAGAIVDEKTFGDIEKLKIDVDDYLERFDAYPVFQKSGDMIMTGPTGANVSDLMILLTKKQN